MKSTKTSLKRVSLEDTKIKMVITPKVSTQIKYLCKEIPKLEWSGILWCTIEGSINQPDKMVITCQDILPLDIGQATFTKYTTDAKVMQYWSKIGVNHKLCHIHSHQSFKVYFSETDMQELEDNSPNHNYYVSLIVNNAGEREAKVSFIGQTKTLITRKDEEGDVEDEFTEDVLYYYDCEIEEGIVDLDKEFLSNINNLLEQEEKKKFENISKYQDFNLDNVQWNKSVNNNSKYKGLFDEEDYLIEDVTSSNCEEFTLFLLDLGNDTYNAYSVDTLMDSYKTQKVKPKDLSASVLERLDELYDTYFYFHKSKNKPEVYKTVLKEVIAEITFYAPYENEEDKELYDLYIEVIKSLENYVKNLDKKSKKKNKNGK